MTEKATSWPTLGSALRQRIAPIWRRRRQPDRDAAGPAGSGHGGWRVVMLDSITGIEAARWDAVAETSSVTRSHGYLRAIELTGVDDCRFFYPLVYDANGTLVAHACVYVITTDFAQLLPRWLATATRAVRRWWPRLCTVRVTECAIPLTTGSSISVAPGIERRSAAALIEVAMTELAQAERSRLLVIRDFFNEDCAEMDFLLKRGYKRVSNLPLARIPVRWTSYDEYLGSMRSRYRKDIKRRLRRAAQNGSRVELLSEFADGASLWAEQAAATHENVSDFKREQVNEDYYRHMDAELGELSLLLVIDHHGRHTAHGMVLLDDTQTIAIRYGRETNAPDGEWFQLVNELVRLGIDRGSKFINLGIGSYDTKALFGADICAWHVYTRCTNRFANAIIRLVPDLMKLEQPATRRLFRQALTANENERPGNAPAWHSASRSNENN